MQKSLVVVTSLLFAGPAIAEEFETLGFGRLFTNDYLGDGSDRWRTGSYQLSILRGTGWDGTPPRDFGSLLEYRLRTEIISAGPDSGATFDRPYVGATSFGLHNYMSLGLAQVSLGVDVTAIGPQTGVADFQEWFHETFGLPDPRGVDAQLDDAFYVSGLGEISYNLRLSDTVTIRPFAEVQTGVEDLIRIGGDILVGSIGHTDLLVRDHGTGQLVRTIADGTTGAALVMGADWAYVTDSVYLPESMGYLHQEDRMRGRIGVHWQIRPEVSFFYGLTYLSEEFVGQSQGQTLGSLRLNFSF